MTPTHPINQPAEEQGELPLEGQPKIQPEDRPIAQPEKLQLAREVAAYLNSICR